MTAYGPQRAAGRTFFFVPADVTLNQDQGGIPGSARVTAVPEQVSSDTGGEFVVLGLDSGRYHSMEDVAARLWSLVQEGRTVAELERVVVEEYDVEPATARADLQRFVAELRDRGLVTINVGAE